MAATDYKQAWVALFKRWLHGLATVSMFLHTAHKIGKDKPGRTVLNEKFPTTAHGQGVAELL